MPPEGRPLFAGTYLPEFNRAVNTSGEKGLPVRGEGQRENFRRMPPKGGQLLNPCLPLRLLLVGLLPCNGGQEHQAGRQDEQSSSHVDLQVAEVPITDSPHERDGRSRAKLPGRRLAS